MTKLAVFGMGDGHQSNQKGLIRTFGGSTREFVCQDKRRKTAVKEAVRIREDFILVVLDFLFLSFFFFVLELHRFLKKYIVILDWRGGHDLEFFKIQKFCDQGKAEMEAQESRKYM